jgi:catechol 1,2-dioxygenase
MDRKKFIKALAAFPLISVPLKLFARQLNAAVPCKTEKDAEGPFYKADAPVRAVLETSGDPLVIEGTVFQSDSCETPVPHAILDVWHCDKDGEYDMQGFKGRGQITADAKGSYRFSTIFPPPYGGRPRHIHFKIRAAGRRELTTQLYFQGDPNIQNDFARNAEKSRIIKLTAEKNTKRGVFDIYL